MLGTLLERLNDWPLSASMLVVAAGFTLGRFTWRRVSLGPAAGTLLVALRRAADSNEPALSYATAYAIGSVVLTIAGPLVVAWAG